MLSLPKAAEPLVCAFSVAFTRPTFQRFIVLLLGAILSWRDRTVSGLLRAAGPLAQGHWSTFHRVLCRRVWSLRSLGKVLAAMVLELVPQEQPVICPVDETTVAHKGKRVFGKSAHRDPCRSTHKHVAWVWGHKWVVLAINIKFSFATRPWALPVLAALYRPLELDLAHKRRHKTPLDLARQLMATLMHWFPQRKFILLGDGGYASHELSRFCDRHSRRLTLISRFHSDAKLYRPPPVSGKKVLGRPRVVGKRLASPQQVVEGSKGKLFIVDWYGGKKRRVQLIWGEGHWYKAAFGLVFLRWVFVHDLEGTHRDEYFFSTQASLPPQQIVSFYTGRWSVEVTFQEIRIHLGFATPRNWSAKSVLRTTPCLLGLFSLVSLIFQKHSSSQTVQPVSFAWYSKSEVTFVDALTAVRRLCWAEVFSQSPKYRGVKKLARPLRIMLLEHLSRAA